ncbi:MAG: division/cell wall cluster transcriptional repressor MraZ [Pygmaiobacter sp.]
MLTGEYRQKVDEKGRLNFPAKFRDEMGETFYVTRWLDECLIALPEAKFEQVRRKLSESGMVKNRALRRMLYSGAELEKPDKQGRILLPAHLREHAAIENDTVVIGVDDYVEIWNPERWRAMTDSMRDGEMAAAMEGLDI